MNSAQYLDELRRQLQGLPQEEIDSCVRYYEEYLADAGPDQQEAAMERLGSPSQTAAQLKADWAVRSMEAPGQTRPRQGLKTLWVVLLALLAVPVGLPRAAAAFCVALALALAALAVIVSLFAAFLALVVAGLAALAAGAVVAPAHGPTGLLWVGAGLTLAALGGLGLIGSLALARLSVRGLIRITDAMRRKRR